MGTQTIVFGYIELPESSSAGYEKTLSQFGFDELFPFRCVFSSPKSGYRSSMVSFADNIKAGRSEWAQWVSKFEMFLSELDATAAKVCFESDEFEGKSCFSYLRTADTWIRWDIETKEIEVSEIALS